SCARPPRSSCCARTRAAARRRTGVTGCTTTPLPSSWSRSTRSWPASPCRRARRGAPPDPTARAGSGRRRAASGDLDRAVLDADDDRAPGPGRGERRPPGARVVELDAAALAGAGGGRRCSHGLGPVEELPHGRIGLERPDELLEV